MDEYISIKSRHVAALILIKAKSGRRPPVMRNLKAIYFEVPRRNNKVGIPAGLYCEVVEE